MSRIFWDTHLFIYLLEDGGALTQSVERLARRMKERGDQLFTSTLTLGEVLVRPTELRNRELCDRYENVLARRATLIPFDVKAARFYATVRQVRAVKPPDAIQLACAAQAGIDMFITNDDRLAGMSIPGIQFIVSLRGAFL